RPGQGARFKIYLPAVQENIGDLNPVKVCAEPCAGAEVILLVEDQELLRHLVGELLRSWGYTVLEASNGNEALSISKGQKGPIGLMVTDVEMPEMSGPELARHLSPLRPEMKVLFMSGYTMETFGQDGMSQAGTEFLQKPFTATALLSRLKDLLGAGPPNG
ncbi:MAG: hybrid sensor histidine kinase/response regulator, partial [Acidobacteria bacterium]